MPLGRFGVRNEYELGGKELYENAVENEDSKAILDGVSVAGLVGLLRQLGDLSLFAAEIFHGLQEQVASTASRNRKLVTRVQRVEASLLSLEKPILSQTSHLRFAYTPGSEWHPRIETEQNHFICGDLPYFIMDFYEECCEPPRLQLLDRFDTSGPGSCLKRYTNPTFFTQTSASTEACFGDKSQRERRAHKIKRKRSWKRSTQLSNSLPDMNNSRRMPISHHTDLGGSSLSQTGSTLDSTFRSEPEHKSNSRHSKESMAFVESLSHPIISKTDFNYHQNAVVGKDAHVGLLIETNVSSSSDTIWDENLEIMEHLGLSYRSKDYVQLSPRTNNLYEQHVPIDDNNSQGYVLSEHASSPGSSALNDVDEEKVKPQKHPVTILDFDTELIRKNSRVAKVQDLDATNIDCCHQDLEQVNSEHSPRLPSAPEREYAFRMHNLVTGNRGSMQLISNGSFVGDSVDGKLTIGDILKTSDDSNSEVETVNRNHVAVSIPPLETVDRNHIGVAFEGVNNINVIESRQYEDIDSEIDDFVDALNTIDSESESDFETYTEKVESEKASGDPMGEHECQSRSYNREEGSYDCLEKHTFPLSLEDVKSSKQSTGQERNSQAQFAHEQSIQCALSFSGKIQDLHICGNAEEIRYSCQDSQEEETVCAPHTIREVPVAPISSYPYDFWTNGDLFELQPSKPTVPNRSNVDTNDLCSRRADFPAAGRTQDIEPLNPKSVNESAKSSNKSLNSNESNIRIAPPSSPPLQHMNISFRSVDGFETSRLKLIYADGINHHEMSADTFPSFQLVPEFTRVEYEIASDSDDDTFCRSYPHVSDESRSHHSDSDSDQWENGESSESRLSSTTSSPSNNMNGRVYESRRGVFRSLETNDSTSSCSTFAFSGRQANSRV